MGFNFVSNIKSCYVDVPNLLYYSHIPTAILALAISVYVFLKINHWLARYYFLFHYLILFGLLLILFYGLLMIAEM